MKAHLAFYLGLLIGILPQTLFADGFIVVHEPPVARPGHYRFAPLEVKYHRVQTDIRGSVATTVIDQEFFNPNQRDLEGDYLFPVPKGAQIDDFQMSINGKMTSAELLDAQQARKIYEDIVRKMRDPALLEYADRDLFRVRIYPIEARKAKRILLTYTEILKTDFGLTRYTYPLNTEKFSASPIDDVSVVVDIQSDHPVKTIFSPSHDIEITRPSEDRVRIAYEAKAVRPDIDFQLYFAGTDTQAIGLQLLTHRQEGEDGFFALLASPGTQHDPALQKSLPKDILLVIDTSGSMAGEKLEQAKRAMEFCIQNFNDADRFEIVRFSTEAEPFFKELRPTTEANREAAIGYVQGFRPRGGTAIEDALRTALKFMPERDEPGRPFMVLFLTDGLPTIGERDRDALVRMVTEKTEGSAARIFCFGVGTDINTHLLDQITEQTRAASEYVLPNEDIEVKVSNLYTKIDSPVLTNLALRFAQEIRPTQYHPNPLPDLFRGDQLVVLGRYSGAGESTITLEGRSGQETRSFEYPCRFPESNQDHAFIPRMWATRRVGYLLDQIRLHGENEELRTEVTRLARRYGVVTPYTAYLIVEDETRQETPRSRRVFARPEAASPAQRADAMRILGDQYHGLTTRESGDAAVAGARITSDLKRSSTPMAAGANAAPWAASTAPSLSAEDTAKVQAYLAPVGPDNPTSGAQATGPRLVEGRLFYRNGRTWVDSLAMESKAEPLRIQCLSDAYFQWIELHPEAKPWLALGTELILWIDGGIVEIYE